MSDFLNPYQFIPTTGTINGNRLRTPLSKIASGASTCRARHDLWQADTKSGRVICRLHLDTPIVVGAVQEEDKIGSTRVLPYGRNGQPAVPGNSLRGMVASLAEALSQSSLRVLEDRQLVVTERLRGGATRPVRAGNVHEYFRAVDPDLLPWKTPDRSHLTPAELIFGVVDEREEDSGEGATAAFHLASRVRFSDALPHPECPPVVGAEVMFKVLASPKGRYPGMYFHPRDKRGTFIPKNRFYSTTGRHNAGSLPNGRKIYLHHRAEDVAAERWVTVDPRRNAEQKLHCKPIRNERYGESHSDLYFHLDFENLSNSELTLLVASLRPSPEFRHRLGLGKPLGLGTVEVAIEGVFLIDRVARYTKKDLLDAPRYHEVWRTASLATECPWAWRYPGEAERLSPVSTPVIDASPLPNFWDQSLIDDETLAVVKTLGDPALVQAPVHTPTVDGYGPEERTFEWFVQNETAVGQKALPKVDPGLPLTLLRSYPRPAGRGGGGRVRR